MKCVQLIAEEIEADQLREFEEDSDEENRLISEDASLEIKGARCAAHTRQLTGSARRDYLKG